VRSLLLACCLVAAACGAKASDDADSQDQAFAKTDFAEDSLLPYSGGWLDVPHALAGVGQFDRLKSTVHDGSKCSTMVALAAAIVGGRAAFLAFVAEVAKLRAGHAADLAITAQATTSVDALTPRMLHELTEVVVRAYGVEYGAYDGQIATMIRASGWTSEKVGSSKPADLVASLDDGDIVPLATIADNEAHITLLWKDASGVVRMYDSDDIHGPHVLPRGTALYDARVDDPQSAWDLREKFVR
jgi:hypothetical protein